MDRETYKVVALSRMRKMELAAELEYRGLSTEGVRDEPNAPQGETFEITEIGPPPEANRRACSPAPPPHAWAPRPSFRVATRQCSSTAFTKSG